MKYFTVSHATNSIVSLVDTDTLQRKIEIENKRTMKREFYILVQLWEQTHFENTSSHTKGE